MEENNNRIFRSMIKCLECKYAFTYVSTGVLTCSGYRTKKVCSYCSYTENEIIDLIKTHLERRSVEFIADNNYLKTIIKRIYLGREGKYKIQFTDGETCGFDGYTLIL
jgi:hypothetical protein